MGLLKQFLKDVLGNAAEDIVTDALGSTINKGKSKIQQSVSSRVFSPKTKPDSKPESKPEPQPERVRVIKDWNAYFREIIATEFAQYSVKENVPVTDLVGFANDEFKLYKDRPTQAYKAEWGCPYTFVLEQAGVPKGVVMLGKGNSHSSNVKYLISRMYAKKLGIPYINFYTQMDNEREYVIGRIRKFML